MADTETTTPGNRTLPHLGTYVRNLPVTLDRMFENALDWEHLPHLHDNSFKAITCRSAGNWGWHCDAVLPNDETIELELRLDRHHQRWITRTLSGSGAGSEIWSYVFERPEGGLRVVVDFFVPDIPQNARENTLAYFTQLYAGLYDEDEDMMVGRQAALEAKPSQATALPLGQLDDVRSRLPIVFALGGKTFRLLELDGELMAHAAQCPHMLGPLDQVEIIEGTLRCPWHGYVFDVKTGKALAGQTCQLATAPNVEVGKDSEVTVTI